MAKYSFYVPSFHINQIRSAHTDTLFASTSLRVNNAPGGLHHDWGAQTVALGDRKAGGDVVYPLAWLDVDVPDPTPENPDGGAVYWTYLLVNKGHSNDAAGFLDMFNNACNDMAGALAGGLVAKGGLTVANLAGFAAVLGIQELMNMLTADCDGVVAVGSFAYTARELAAMVAAPGQVSVTTQDNPGTDSAVGCGGNSDYTVDYWVQRAWVSRPAPPGGHLAAGRQVAGFGQTDVFFVDNSGALNVCWVVEGGIWQGPQPLTRPGFAVPGTPVLTSPQFGTPDQLDVFLVDRSGSLNVMWADGLGGWQGPQNLGHPAAGPLPAGAALAVGTQFGIADQTDVFAIDADGMLNVWWVNGGGTWQGPVAVGEGPVKAAAGAAVATSQQFGVADQTDVFVIDADGMLNVWWVNGGGIWQGPQPVGAGAARVAGSTSLVATQQSGAPDQTDVLAIDSGGNLTVWWVNGPGTWQGPDVVGGGPVAVDGQPALAASPQLGATDQTDVFVVDRNGRLNVFWVNGPGTWQGPHAFDPPGMAPAGAALAASPQYMAAGSDQTDAFVIDHSGNVAVYWVNGPGTWQGPVSVPPPTADVQPVHPIVT